MVLVLKVIFLWVVSVAAEFPPLRLTVYGRVELHWMLSVPCASLFAFNTPADPKLMLVALTLQLLVTVAVTEDEVLAVEPPTGHGPAPLLPYRMKGSPVNVEEYEPGTTACW